MNISNLNLHNLSSDLIKNLKCDYLNHEINNIKIPQFLDNIEITEFNNRNIGNYSINNIIKLLDFLLVHEDNIFLFIIKNIKPTCYPIIIDDDIENDGEKEESGLQSPCVPVHAAEPLVPSQGADVDIEKEKDCFAGDYIPVEKDGVIYRTNKDEEGAPGEGQEIPPGAYAS